MTPLWQRGPVLLAALLAVPIGVAAKADRPAAFPARFVCGTSAQRTLNALLRTRYHDDRRAQDSGRDTTGPQAAPVPRPLAVDTGDVAVIEDDGTVVIQPSPFDLAGRAVLFEPAGTAAFRVRSSTTAYSSTGGTSVTLGDDDSRSVDLGFSFPFYGTTYTSVSLNSDGNLTFGSPDAESGDRDLARFSSGPPRVGPFFADLDPTTGRVAFRAETDAITFVWDNVAVYSEFGPNQFNSFSIKLFRNGNIEFAYGARVQGTDVLVGISPGANLGGIHALKYTRDLPTPPLTGTLVEIFASQQSFSETALARRFFETHPDDFDQLVVFLAFPQGLGDAFAYELNVRNEVGGIALGIFDDSSLFGSAGRLRSFLNMGPLSGRGRYPADPYETFLGTNNTIDILGQEAGHRWLAFLRFRDGAVNSRAILGRDFAHWSFFFDSDASVMEGNDIEDRGAGLGSQRFLTVGATSTYSLLDQYVMGLVGKSDVPNMFLVENPVGTDRTQTDPRIGVAFGGNRKEVTIDGIIAANGARTPSVDAAPKVFRQAFVLVTGQGQAVAPGQIAKVQAIRDAWVKFYSDSTAGRGWYVTDLQRTAGTTETTLNFPSFTGTDKRFTGIAVANWGATPADLFFTAYDNGGNVLASPAGIVNPRVITIPPRQQIALLGEQIHGLRLTDPRNGWIQARSTSSQVSGFFLDGDIDLTLLDGAVASSSTATELYFTRAQLGGGSFVGSYHNLIDVVNPGPVEASLELTLVDEFGASQGRVARTLPPRGRLAEDLGTLFPGVASSRSQGYVRLKSSAGVVGYQSIDGGSTVFALPAQPPSSSARLYSAQVASGGGANAFFTDCNFVNTASSTRTLQLALIGNDGQAVTGVPAPAPIVLAPGAALRARGETIFNLPDAATSPALVQGSLVVTADGPGVIGDVIFGDPASERFLASLPLDGTPVADLVFSQVAQGSPDGGKPYFTGLALYNPGAADVSIALEVFSEKGNKTGSATLALAAGNRVSKTLPELVPAVSSQVRGYIRLAVTGGAIVAFELFGDQALEFLAAVPPQPIVP